MSKLKFLKKDNILLFFCSIILVVILYFTFYPIYMWFFHDRRLDYCLEFSECKEDFYAIVDYLDSTYSLDGERSFALKYDNEKNLAIYTSFIKFEK